MSLQQQVDDYLASQRFLLSAASFGLHDRADFCPTCRGSKGEAFPECYQCHNHRQEALSHGWQLADRTAFICYGDAKGADQLGADMFTYKNEGKVHLDARTRIASLLFHTLFHYSYDVNSGYEQPISMITTVPSTRSAQRNQLARIVERVTVELPGQPPVGQLLRPKVLRGNAERGQRRFDPSLFDCEPADGHVMIIEDSWVTGANVQSAAAALHRAGANYVTVLSVARLIYPEVFNLFQLHQHRFISGDPSQSPF